MFKFLHFPLRLVKDTACTRLAALTALAFAFTFALTQIASAQNTPDNPSSVTLEPLPAPQALSQPTPSQGLSNSDNAKVPSVNPINHPKIEGHPIWQDLTPDQKLALAPLQKFWPKMSDVQKQKWLVISKNFATLEPDVQIRLQSRMRDWVSLSTQERAAARLNFAEVSKLSEDDKKQKWEAYQALEPEAKLKLLEAAQPLPKGAAIAIKPTNKDLLTFSPESSQQRSSSVLPRIDVSGISPKTLLALQPVESDPNKAPAPTK
jgi:hypothetical protein